MLRRVLTFCSMIAVVVPSMVMVAPASPAAAAGDDTVLTFGDAAFAGSTSGMALTQRLVGIAANRSGTGYWLVARDGGIFTFGASGFHGSTGDIVLNAPIVAMSATVSGAGYRMVAADGGIFTFGDAGFLGSMGAVPLTKPVVGMATTPSGDGYWMVAADGGIFTFGDAGFFGSAASEALAKPIVAMAATPTGGGYWLVGGDGAVYSYGDAPYLGNGDSETVVAIAATPTGQGYRTLDAAGGVHTFGDASFQGAGPVPAGKVAIGMAITPSGDGYWMATADSTFVGAGAVGAAVTAVQQRLDALGYWVPVDGRFGPTTIQALYALQKAARIPRTGQVDDATRQALAAGIVPTPRTADGYVAEIDKANQLLMLVQDGRVLKTFNVSTGNGARYRSGSGTAVARTPEGSFTIYREINGLRISELGELFRPKYFTGGYAIHGSPSIPPTPASHGCVRVSNPAINFLWDSGMLAVGTSLLVYS